MPDAPLVLASNSRGRRELMERAGYAFTVRASDIPEPTEAADGDIRHYVADLAWRKARAVAETLDSAIVIAADTVGWHHGQVVGKPADEADARRIVRELAGTTHELWTGVCLWHRPTDMQYCWQELSRVAVVAMSEADIDRLYCNAPLARLQRRVCVANAARPVTNRRSRARRRTSSACRWSRWRWRWGACRGGDGVRFSCPLTPALRERAGVRGRPGKILPINCRRTPHAAGSG